jgi:putative sigma-54 modulation protein
MRSVSGCLVSASADERGGAETGRPPVGSRREVEAHGFRTIPQGRTVAKDPAETRLARKENWSVQINITARHGHLSPATQERITEKVEPIRKFFDRVTATNVLVDLEHRDSPTVELLVTAEHHEEFVARAEADTVMAGLDAVIDKMEQQLRKHKERLKEHKATSPKHIEPAVSESDAE